ncbi:MAG TPA: hypothetical protein VF729_02200, partial [Solirubrobacterales bacterium]
MEFRQDVDVTELYRPEAPAPAGGLVYLLPRGTPNPPATLTFADSWTACRGAYLLLEEPVPAGGGRAFADAAWAFLEDRRLAGTRFAWLEVPAAGLAGGAAIQVEGSGAGAVLAFPASLPLGSIAVEAAAGTAVGQDLAATAFTFTAAASGGLALSAQWGAARVGVLSSAMTLPLTGEHAGCLQFGAHLQPADLDAIDAGLRFFYALPPEPESPQAPASEFFLSSLRVPLLSAATRLHGNVDPLAPLDGARTFFAFDGTDAGQPGTAPGPQATNLRTKLGDEVSLRPLSGAEAPSCFASFVLAPNRLASAPTPGDPVYLVPRGDFELQPAGKDLMCGLSGVEYVQLARSGGNLLSFFPGAGAFAPGFYPGEPAGYTSLEPEPENAPTTSFAWVSATKTLTYFAQPDQSVLYNHGDLAPVGFTALSAVPVEAAGLAPGPTATHAFPLLPYAGLGAGLAAFGQLESQVVSPLRRARIAAAATPPAAEPEAARTTLASRLSTTPQGLLAAYAPGATSWDEVVLGKMEDGHNTELKLTEVKGKLLEAFQSNKLFLVATLPNSMAALDEFSKILVGGEGDEAWDFDLKPADWHLEPGRRTMLILKYHDRSIAELAGDTGSWASPDHFNEHPEEVSEELLEAISRVERTDTDFAAFLAAVEDREWNGVLALNVEAPLEALPAQLAGLAVGIDQSAFYAHHVGIALSQIDAGGTELTCSSSSIFGLLDYSAPAKLPPGSGEFAFQVERLKVLFLNSAVAAFSSIVALEVNTLFGEHVTLLGGEGNIVRLYGVYQKHAVAGRVEGSYTFQTAGGAVSVFEVESQVLNAVVLAKGQFVTLTAKDTKSKTFSQFVFWGQLDFKALEKLDAFSFGRKAPTDPATGLAFGNLVIGMSFDPQAKPPVASFEFDASQLGLDVATSAEPREHSLLRHFPLAVSSFSQGKAGTTPDGLGYMGVQSALTQSPLAFPWFSLDFDLDLGSPGALAAEVGFVASLCVAWSPHLAPEYAVFLGLRLPGSSGAKRQISIEGIFDIGFRTLALESPEPDTYTLVLYGIGFKFLSFTFPPSGQVNFVLFGNPKASAADEPTLGWYAAYAKPDAKPSPKVPSA